jgi:hypothetical protein
MGRSISRSLQAARWQHARNGQYTAHFLYTDAVWASLVSPVRDFPVRFFFPFPFLFVFRFFFRFPFLFYVFFIPELKIG